MAQDAAMLDPSPRAVVVPFGRQTDEVGTCASQLTERLTEYLDQGGFACDVARHEGTVHVAPAYTDDALRCYELGKHLGADLVFWGEVRREVRQDQGAGGGEGPAPCADALPLRVDMAWFDFRTGDSIGFFWQIAPSTLQRKWATLDDLPVFLRELPVRVVLPQGPPMRESLAELETRWGAHEPLRGFLGVDVRDSSGDVTLVMPDSPAEVAGLQVGDMIEVLNEQPVARRADVRAVLSQTKEGDTLRVRYRHGRTARAKQVVLPSSERWCESRERKRLDAPAPDFETLTRHGETLRPSDLRGQVVLLHFWATWCGSCSTRMPTVLYCHERFADQGLRVLCINEDREREVASDYLRANKLPLTHVLDHAEGSTDSAIGPLGQLYGVVCVPYDVVVDRRGAIRALGFGGVELVQAIRHWLTQP